ncbi:ribosome silencing factor [bacterium]|nr:ribosome silencing factor [bacterium]
MVLTQDTIDRSAVEAARVLDEGKGRNIILLDLSPISAFADYFIIATGDSHVHMQALANQVRQTLSQTETKITSSEGRDSKTWILLDYGSIIIHIMSEQARNYYGLETLWGDAEEIDWTVSLGT